MKKLIIITGTLKFAFILFFLMSVKQVAGQKTVVSSPPMPDELNKIFRNSCTPCHTNDGGFMSKYMLNFDNWTGYSEKKQAGKAGKIYSMLSGDRMPPKSARKKAPDIIPTKAQIELIKKWADSLNEGKK